MIENNELFEASLGEIHADQTLACDLYFKLPSTSRLLRVHEAGGQLTAPRYMQYQSKNVLFVWIPREQFDAFASDQRRHPTALRDIAKPLLKALMEARGERSFREAWNLTVRVIRRILILHPHPGVMPPSEDLKLLWNAAKYSPQPGHALRVATLSVLFAMLFEDLSPASFPDIALAGLLHDIGTVESAYRNPERTAAGPRAGDSAHGEHVSAGARILKEYFPRVKPNILRWIAEHHERFDGSGYPESLEGFEIDDLSQILGIANLLDDFFSGAQDDKPRSMKEAVAELCGLERKPPFPQYFNPDIFAEILKNLI